MSPSAETLAARYATRGPRYTSYPTAPNFREDVEIEGLSRCWESATAPLSLYLHIPYCQVRCLFCGCHTEITQHRDRGQIYTDDLLAELDGVATRTHLGRPLQQLAMGGGTPNFLMAPDMRRLVEGIESRCSMAADAERSIEVDPRAITPQYVRMLVELGFNRFSMGVQDLDQAVMAAVNRPQALATVTEVVDAIRATADLPINMDLIYGLPCQTELSWSSTLDSIIAIRPSRLAVYGYAHVPWMKKHQAALERHDLPDDELRSTLNAMARERYIDAGYQAIGFDHYALPEDELAIAARNGGLNRNFMGYTTRRGLDLVALGVSGISSVGGSYTQNHKPLDSWRQAVRSGEPSWYRGLVLSAEDVHRREAILEISCNFRLDLNQQVEGQPLSRHFAPELDALEPLRKDGLIDVEDGALRVTELGLPFVRNICMVFDQYLPTRSDGRFSRTS
jgi:oxygen-independent coproporphyrinogen-3 oxidase